MNQADVDDNKSSMPAKRTGDDDLQQEFWYQLTPE